MFSFIFGKKGKNTLTKEESEKRIRNDIDEFSNLKPGINAKEFSTENEYYINVYIY